ncbi:MAG: hypothetical protein PHT69_06295 [Bacteroidales bacterium]|nr:hypothetical protein [Bacteroidales bacterium]
MKIIFDYSAWYLLLFLLLGGGLAYILYIRNNKEDFPQKTRYLLFFIRLICFSFIAFFLLNPLLRMMVRQTEKPIIIFAQDNSESIRFNPDSAFYSETYPALINDFLKKLEADFHVFQFSFGENVSENLGFNFNEKLTDIGKMLDYSRSTFYNRNVGAMVLASDGLYNKGINPVYSLNNITYPIYTLALGDTNVYKDAILEKLHFNKVVFLNNKFPLEINISAHKAKGQSCNLIVNIDDKTVHNQRLNFNDEDFIQTISLVFDADKPGKRKISVSLSPIEGEINTVNNAATVFFDVIDNRSKILLLFNAPHPDVAAIKSAIENNVNYEVISQEAGSFRGNFESYNLVILHNLPSQTNAANHFFTKLNTSDVPVFYILGNQSNINLFNTMNTGLTISNVRGNVNEAMPAFNRDFNLFTLDDKTKITLGSLPPLNSFFGQYNFMPSVNIVFFQKIGQVITRQPMLMFNEMNGKKTAVMTGEGYWRWRLVDFARNGNQDATNEIINKTVQYLALKLNKDNFRIITKDIFYENENILFDAEVYNESFEPVNSEDINLAVKDENNKVFTFVFSKTSDSYTLDAGRLPVGHYTYQAQVKNGNNILQRTGSFIVAPLNIESLNTIADHRILYNMSVKNNAELFYPNNLDALYNKILENEEIKPVIYEKIDMSELINLYGLLFFIALLLSIEWFTRKWNGSY